jgi:uncharacterized HAD superfamily protein
VYTDINSSHFLSAFFSCEKKQGKLTTKGFLMNIGIDVDGVLTNLEKYQKKYAQKHFKDRVYNDECYHLKDAVGCGDKEEKRFWYKHIWKYCVFEPARKNASQVIEKLRSDGHKISIITGRVLVPENSFLGWPFRSLLTGGLKRNRIIYDDICYCSTAYSARDKAAVCLKYSIDVMIEDIVDNLRALCEITKVLCFDAGYNRGGDIGALTRVNNWTDAYAQIKAIMRI